jgi:hypothetical protein
MTNVIDFRARRASKRGSKLPGKTLKRGESCSTVGPLLKIRFWLIRLIAGKSVILLNAKLDMVEPVVDGDILVNVFVDSVDGLLMSGTSFALPDECALRIRQNPTAELHN